MRGRGRVAVSGVQSGVVMTSPHSGGGRGAAGSDRRSVEPAAPRTVSTWGAGCGDRVRTTTKRRVAPAAWNRLSRHDLADAWRAALLPPARGGAYGAPAGAGGAGLAGGCGEGEGGGRGRRPTGAAASAPRDPRVPVRHGPRRRERAGPAGRALRRLPGLPARRGRGDRAGESA